MREFGKIYEEARKKPPVKIFLCGSGAKKYANDPQPFQNNVWTTLSKVSGKTRNRENDKDKFSCLTSEVPDEMHPPGKGGWERGGKETQ